MSETDTSHTDSSTTRRRGAGPFLLKVLQGSLYKFGGVLLSFLVLLVLARALGPREFGIYSVALSLAGMAWPLGTFGQPVSMVRFWPPIEEKYGRAQADFVLMRGLRIVTLGAIVVFAIFGVLAAFEVGTEDFQGSPALILWTGGLAVALAYAHLLKFALRAQGQLNWALMPHDILWRLGVIGAVLTSTFWATGGRLDGEGAVILSVVVLAALVVAQLVSMVRRMSPASKPPADMIKTMRQAQWSFYGIAISRQWLQQAATVVVAFTLGPVAAGGFFAAQRLANLLSLILVGANLIADPVIAKDWHADRRASVQRLVTVIAALAGAAAMIGLLIYVWLGPWMLGLFDPAYRDVFAVLIILGFGQVINALCGPNNNLLSLAGQEKSLLMISIAAGLANIVFTAIGAYVAGVTGAAFGSMLATLLWNLWATWLCQHRLGVVPLRFDQLRDIGSTLKDIRKRRRARKSADTDEGG